MPQGGNIATFSVKAGTDPKLGVEKEQSSEGNQETHHHLAHRGRDIHSFIFRFPGHSGR